MKRKNLSAIIIILFLSGCRGSYPETPPLRSEPPPALFAEDTSAPGPHNAAFDFIIEEKIAADGAGGAMTAADILDRERIGLTAETIERMIAEQRGLYHFDRLDPYEQLLYVEILTIIREYASGIMISALEPAVIEKVFQCVLNDHPEIFYAVGYGYTKYSLEEVTKKIAFTAKYNVSLEEMKNRQRKIAAYAAACLSGLPEGAGEYEKTKYIYEYLINYTEYDAMAEDSQNICSVFLRGRSVCQGYAKATQYLLREAGIPATLVRGKVTGGESHAWNIALIDGEYYHIDTTFGDASYQITGNTQTETANPWNNGTWPINYDYFCVTTAQIEKTHRIEEIVPLVKCAATANNYYIREGLYFTAVDEDKLQALFDKEYALGNRYVTLKCADIQVYKEMADFLIEQQKIFGYLRNNDGVIRYANMEEQLSISFWL